MENLIKGQRTKINPLDEAIDEVFDFTELEQRIVQGTPDPNKKIKIFRNKNEEAVD